MTTATASSLVIRPARREDLTQLAEVTADELSLAQLENRWREQEAGYRTLIVAEEDGRAVGNVSLYARSGPPAPLHLFALEVAQDWRSRGIGTALIDYVLEQARSARRDSVYLEVRCDNKGARRLYHRLGFRRVGPEFINTWWRFNDDGTREVVEEASMRMVKRVRRNKRIGHRASA